MPPVPDSISQRAASADDRDLLWRIFRASMQQSITAARGSWDEQRERQQFFDQLDLASTKLLLHNSQIVGFFSLSQVEGIPNLHTICIDPQYQNSGFGASVVRDLISQAARAGLPLRLSVLKSNPAARRLYDRLGFHTRAESDHHIHLEHRPAL